MNYPWPTEMYDIFKPGNRLHTADISWQSGSLRKFGYIDGYTESAKVLIEYLQRETPNWNHKEFDTFVYPIVFLYRHALELSIKRVLEIMYNTVEEDSVLYKKARVNLTNHKLNILWDSFEKFSKQLYKAETKDIAFKSVKKIIQQVDGIDPDGTALRYAMDQKKKELLLKGLDKIDLVQFGQIMQKVCNYFDAAHNQVIVDFEKKMDKFKPANKAQTHHLASHVNTAP